MPVYCSLTKKTPPPNTLSLGPLQGQSSLATCSHLTASPVLAKVSLVALLSIIDHWTHRNMHSNRVIGAVLGTQHDGNVIHVTDTFPIVLLEDDSCIDVDFAATMYALRRRTNAKELVLGWYSTGTDLHDSTADLHAWVEDNLMAASPGSVASAIHLLVDTSLDTDDMSVLGFIGTPVVSLSAGNLGRMFIPLSTSVDPAYHELSALETIATAALPNNDNLAPIVPQVGIPQAQGRIAKLNSLIDGCISLVDDLVSEIVYADKSKLTSAQALAYNQIGHALRQVVQTCTHVGDVHALNSEIRDLKIIMDLARQARKQVQLTELIMYGAAYNYEMD